MEQSHNHTPKYSILNFIEHIQIEDNKKYNRLKDKAIVVYIERINFYLDEEMRSSYTACWGDQIRICGQTNLELNELEELLHQDASILAKEGIYSFIKGGSRKIHSVRRT